jgi:Ca2+-binding EF-hand superfamily protein
MQNCTENTFKKFALRVMAEDLDENKLDVVEKAFRFIDKNGDGTLEVDEIRAALRKYYKEEDEAHEAADSIFEAIDRDLSGTLNFAEFTAVSIGPQEYCDKVNLWECFNRFDKDGNGEFSHEEIAAVVGKVDYLTEGSLIDDVVAGIAQDIVMPVDFDTFVQIMVTPAGQPVDSSTVSWNRMCNQVFKIDAHGVRHLKPKVREEQEVSPLMRNVYRNNVRFATSGGVRSASKTKD